MAVAEKPTFGRRIWENSLTFKITASWLHKSAELKDLCARYGLSKWKPYLESLFVLSIIFMPVIQSWKLILPLLALLWLENRRSRRPVARELFFMGLILVASAVLSNGFRAGISSLTTFSFWLGLAYLVSKAVSPELVQKLLSSLCFSSFIWIIIGFWQQMSGVPTPTGWLGNEQINYIKVRSYSVFGNPNIFALYLLLNLGISCDLIVFFARSLKYRTGFLKNKSSSAYYLPQNGKSLYTRDEEGGVLFWMNLISFVLILCFTLTALYYTYSRFAWLLSLVCLVRFWPRFGKRRWLIAGAVVLFFCTVQGFRIRMAPLLSFTDSSMEYRILIWQGVLKAIADHWLWGTGPGSFGMIYPWYRISNTVSNHAHQLYLQIWFENGILSLMAFLWLFRKPVARCWYLFVHRGSRVLECDPSTKTTPASDLFALIVTIFLAYGLTESWTQNHLISGYFWFFYGLWVSSTRALSKERITG